MENKELSDDLKRIIAKIVEVDVASINDDTNLRDDLEIDSIAAALVMVHIETKYKIEVNEMEATDIITMKDLIEFVSKRL